MKGSDLYFTFNVVEAVISISTHMYHRDSALWQSNPQAFLIMGQYLTHIGSLISFDGIIKQLHSSCKTYDDSRDQSINSIYIHEPLFLFNCIQFIMLRRKSR